MTDPLTLNRHIAAALDGTGITHWRGRTQPQPPAGRPWVHWWPTTGLSARTALCGTRAAVQTETTLVVCGWSPDMTLDAAGRVTAALDGARIDPSPGAAPSVVVFAGPLLADPDGAGYSITLTVRHHTTR